MYPLGLKWIIIIYFDGRECGEGPKGKKKDMSGKRGLSPNMFCGPTCIHAVLTSIF